MAADNACGAIHSPTLRSMGTHMKTTIDIADSLLQQAKRVAAAEGTTVRELVEVGLRRVLIQRQERSVPFELKRASFKGKGLQAAMEGLGWDDIREMAYRGHGGR